QVGSINLTASADSNAIKSTTYTINNSSGDIVAQGEVNFTSATIIDNLPASEEGLKYTISAKSFTYGGYSYTAKPIVVTVTTGSRTDAQLNFTTEKVASAKVNVTIAGMPTGKQTTLHFTSNSGSSQLLEVSDNGVYTEELPKNGDTWTVTADKISGYKASITPSSFVADQNEQNVNLTFEQVAPIESGKKVIGYWENWKPGLISGDYKGSAEDVAPYTHVLYSFLTLDSSPNPENPANKKWNSGHINESMAGADVLSVMGNYQNPWDNNYNWQRVRIDSLISLTHANNGKFIWAIGGWSDLQQTISDDQIDAFVNQVIELLKLGGDGVDFDWEHLSQLADGSPNPNKEQQLATLAKTLKTLRKKLDDEGMSDKQIGYTTRFNAFFESSKDHGFAADFNSDGEGIAIEKWLKDNESSLDEVVNWVNIMAYDVSPNDMPNGKTWTKAVYEDMLNSFSKYVNPSLVVLGFEPGGQAASGEWEGLELDKQMIDYIAQKGFGGSMFWAINQPAMGTASTYYQNVITGDNVNSLANYSQDAFAE
ncbi:glycosyl hydrolase family 18 (putative chitinase), partial [Allofrancisella inopinata]|uniref:glycosyl hydrolase family 18 protein n=1 Tax=Allofrancisella inopinata TaxID=1085647 RepID=UPI001062C737